MCYDKRGSVNNMEQFSRTISLVGQSAFDRVHQARVAVFGVGGVGGYVCEALVRSGIAEIDLFDRDDVSISNLNRQIIALHSTIGQDKVDAMAARLKDINPDVRVNCRKMFYLPTNADEIDLSVYDFVVDAVDTVAAKLELARRCEQGGIRFISAMGAGNKLDPSCLRIADITDTATGKVLVEVDPKYFRPAEVEQLLGDPTKAKTLLGWNPRKTSFEELVKIMVKHDMKFVKKLHLKASC